MYYGSRSSNVIVKQCIHHAMYNYNSGLGTKLLFMVMLIIQIFSAL